METKHKILGILIFISVIILLIYAFKSKSNFTTTNFQKNAFDKVGETCDPNTEEFDYFDYSTFVNPSVDNANLEAFNLYFKPNSTSDPVIPKRKMCFPKSSGLNVLNILNSFSVECIVPNEGDNCQRLSTITGKTFVPDFNGKVCTSDTDTTQNVCENIVNFDLISLVKNDTSRSEPLKDIIIGKLQSTVNEIDPIKIKGRYLTNLKLAVGDADYADFFDSRTGYLAMNGRFGDLLKSASTSADFARLSTFFQNFNAFLTTERQINGTIDQYKKRIIKILNEPPPPEDKKSSGLSTGEKIGIGIGVAVGIIFILLIIGFFLFKNKFNGRSSGGGSGGNYSSDDGYETDIEKVSPPRLPPRLPPRIRFSPEEIERQEKNFSELEEKKKQDQIQKDEERKQELSEQFKKSRQQTQVPALTLPERQANLAVLTARYHEREKEKENINTKDSYITDVTTFNEIEKNPETVTFEGLEKQLQQARLKQLHEEQQRLSTSVTYAPIITNRNGATTIENAEPVVSVNGRRVHATAPMIRTSGTLNSVYQGGLLYNQS